MEDGLSFLLLSDCANKLKRQEKLQLLYERTHPVFTKEEISRGKNKSFSGVVGVLCVTPEPM